jgi:putative protein kinase ArgK-like GTPase of G3E family
MNTIERFTRWLTKGGHLQQRREAHWRARLTDMVRQEVTRNIRSHVLSDAELAEMARRVEAREQDPFTLAPQLVARLLACS